jgi:GNAT superfamily N-acetyltransferase
MLVYYTAAVADVIAQARAFPPGVSVRPLVRDDIPALAQVYLDAYEPAVVSTLEAAASEMTSAFDGEWGPLWPEASLGAWLGGQLVCLVQTVRRPAWDPDVACPWLIEVSTVKASRRRGLARALVVAAFRAIDVAGEPRVGLTVDEDNLPAATLYASLGFRRNDPIVTPDELASKTV